MLDLSASGASVDTLWIVERLRRTDRIAIRAYHWSMTYDRSTRAEVAREIEGLEYALDGRQRSDGDSERQRELERLLELLRQRLRSAE